MSKPRDVRDRKALAESIRQGLNQAMPGIYRAAAELGFDQVECRLAMTEVVLARTNELLWDEHRRDPTRAINRLARAVEKKLKWDGSFESLPPEG